MPNGSSDSELAFAQTLSHYPLPGTPRSCYLGANFPQRSNAILRIDWAAGLDPPDAVMISIVLYGRNDSYGYNLHKRAAISLNCMAAVLTDQNDEIIFVDYNTPDDFPTFPEAIQDTLTKRTREILRILRVRPSIHDRYRSRTRLMALEPIARNVAVRRSSSANRWILSTNTDMIFVPQSEASLSEIARDLTAGFYHAPRIEIPEMLWESLDRQAPETIIDTVREWGMALHLNEIVLGSQLIRYDGPGDFQLLLRDDLFENQAFDEDMLLGWHVDSNISARMLRKYSEVGDLGARVYGYHCDHTRQVTPAHSHTRVQNDWRRFVTNVTSIKIDRQAESWGCAGDTIEEIRLAANPASVYVQGLRNAIGAPLVTAQIVHYDGATYNQVDYEPRHLIPFLADMFVSMPRNWNLAWYGAREETLSLFARIWEDLRFAGKILLEQGSALHIDGSAIRPLLTSEILAEADAFVFDFGGLRHSEKMLPDLDALSVALRKTFRRLVREERRRIASGLGPRRIIALNAHNNLYETFVFGAVAVAATPFATHMRHGFVLPESAAWGDWLPHLAIGEAGVRVGNEIRSDPTKTGRIAYGPNKFLEEGSYLLSVSCALLGDAIEGQSDEPYLSIEITAGNEPLTVRLLTPWQLREGSYAFTFQISRRVSDGIEGIEARISIIRPSEVAIRALTVEPASPLTEADKKTGAAAAKFDLARTSEMLPSVGADADGGAPQIVIFGSHATVVPGSYEMTAQIEANGAPTLARSPAGRLFSADVIAGNTRLVAVMFRLAALNYDEKAAVRLLQLPFELQRKTTEPQQIRMRIWGSGEEPVRIRSLSVRPLERHERQDLFPFLLVGEQGRRINGEIRGSDRNLGRLAYSPALAIGPGIYRLKFLMAIQSADNNPCVNVAVMHGTEIRAISAIECGSNYSEDRELVFAVGPDPTDAGVEFSFEIVGAANVALRSLTLEHAGIGARLQGPTACELDSWLPFLRIGTNAKWDGADVVVNAAREDWAVFGPYWTLPPGNYEMVAWIIPPAFDREGKPIIKVDVATEYGQRQLASCNFRLGRYLSADAKTPVELRLPFTLPEGIPAALRAIETRIFTKGDDGSFRVRSLAVRVRAEEADCNWFPYLVAAECGIHACGEIKTIENEIGCIAYTPPVGIKTGRYGLFLELAHPKAIDGKPSPNEPYLTIELRSELEILAIYPYRPDVGGGPALTFDVTEEIAAGTGIELFFTITTSIAVSIRGLRVQRFAEDAVSPRPTAAHAAKGLAHFATGTPGLRLSQGVLARPGKTGNVGYLRRRLSPGRYEAILRFERVRDGKDPQAQLTIKASGGLIASSPIEFASRQLGPLRIPRGPFRIFSFEVPAGLPGAIPVIEISVDSAGAGGFLIHSVAVEPKTPIRDLRDWGYAAAAHTFGKLRRALKFLKTAT
jgi:hypothetical protein